MTDRQPELMTEAGRRLLDDLFTDTRIFNGESVTQYILAIEAEARADERERLAGACLCTCYGCQSASHQPDTASES